MTTATPEQVLEAVDGIDRRTRGLGELYRRLHPSAWQPRVGDARRALPPIDPATGKPRPAVDDDLAGSDTTRDLSDTLLATASVRRHIARAGRLTVQAELCLATAWKELALAQAAIEASTPTTATPNERQLPRTVDTAERKADRRRLKLAAAYRVDRADLYARANLRLHDTGAGEGA